MANSLFLLWLAAFPLMGSPGPATLSLAGIGTAYGFRSSLQYLAGIILGTTFVLLLISTGVTALVLTEPALTQILTVAATIYLLYLAWKIASAPVGVQMVAAKSPPTMLSGLTLAIANPKAFAAIGSVYTGRTLVANSVIADTTAKVLAFATVIVVVNTAWLAFGSVFSRVLSNPRLGRIANISFAVALIASLGTAFL